MLHRSVKIWHVWCLFCLSLTQPFFFCSSRTTTVGWAGSVGTGLLVHTQHRCICVCVLSYQVLRYYSVMAPGLSHVHPEQIVFTEKLNLLLNQHVRFPAVAVKLSKAWATRMPLAVIRSIPPGTPLWMKAGLWSYSYSLHTNAKLYTSHTTAVITKIISSVS